MRMHCNPKSNTYSEKADVDATGKQESVMNYPMRAVLTCDKYPTKEGNDVTSGISER
jgi:hypothetical protein